jgi:hypothetical protein
MTWESKKHTVQLKIETPVENDDNSYLYYICNTEVGGNKMSVKIIYAMTGHI